MSTRPGGCGEGTADIYRTRRHPTQGWLEPEHLGCEVNSAGNEFSPLSRRAHPREPDAIVWDVFPELEAIAHFARGIGAVRSGNVALAQEALGALEALEEQTSGYWAGQVEIQRLMTVAGWLAHP